MTTKSTSVTTMQQVHSTYQKHSQPRYQENNNNNNNNNSWIREGREGGREGKGKEGKNQQSKNLAIYGLAPALLKLFRLH